MLSLELEQFLSTIAHNTVGRCEFRFIRIKKDEK